MTLFLRVLLLLSVSVSLLPGADPLTGFPFANETLRYTVRLPGGMSMGSATLSSQREDAGWTFNMSLDVPLPIVPITDKYSASTTKELCTNTLQRTMIHGSRKVTEKTEFDAQAGQAHRQTLFPLGGGKSDIAIPTCGRDALTYVYYARREMGQGRLPVAGKVLFGSAYDVRVVYTGAMEITVKEKPVTTDHVTVSVKGPASDISLEIFYARDAARTPLLVKIPVSAGAVSLELVR
jgi:hypothetical protein